MHRTDAASAAFIGLLLATLPPLGSASAAQTQTDVEFASGAVCAECHPSQATAWRGSHHDLAMQRATPASVRGDFDNATFSHFGVTSTFSRRGAGYYVRTDGPDGGLADFEIKYTFGADPLQQYLIEFPDGRLQVLGIAWDTRPTRVGGQRWFHLQSDQPAADQPLSADDWLHWTGPSQNWNHMCAECHSTNLRKRYQPAEDRFETTWSEINVSCEACHGPGAAHVAWARQDGERGDDPQLAIRLGRSGTVQWLPDPNAAGPRRVPERTEHREIEMCARCHSRRSAIHEDYRFGSPLLDQHRVAILDEHLYHPDGQILGEVYVYGSFVQSKMYAAGVSCSDCHEPHSAALRRKGNALCTGCHEPERFDSAEHHHHPKQSDGAQCVECHMPTRTYMQIDPRRDHSLRIPRPDLSSKLGTPNPCTTCHAAKTNQWASRVVGEWRGTDRPLPPHWGEAIHAGRTADRGAAEQLLRVITDESVPAIARATAVSLFPRYAGPRSLPIFQRAIGDPDPLVRIAALGAVAGTEAEVKAALASDLLADPIRSVRFEAARILVDVPAERLRSEDRERLAAVLRDFRAAQQMDSDRAEAHLRLGMLEEQQGNLERAQLELEQAIALDANFVPAYVNLADLHRAAGKDVEGEGVLRRALERDPLQPDVHHALGLLLVRLGRLDEALPELQQAAELRSDMSRYAFIWAVALHSNGDVEGARRVLRDAASRHPGDRQIGGFLKQLDSQAP